LQASDLRKSRAYDLAITDLAMPNKHGHSLLVELLAGHPRLVIMVHSSIDDSRLSGDWLLTNALDVDPAGISGLPDLDGHCWVSQKWHPAEILMSHPAR
jgi:hypothetical protein